MYTNNESSGCATAIDPNVEAMVIPAGSAHEDLCNDYMDELAGFSSLPVTIIKEQEYTYAFCPNEALQRGTLFPELVG